MIETGRACAAFGFQSRRVGTGRLPRTWSSLSARPTGLLPSLRPDWPVARPRNWLALVNRPRSEKELEEIRRCVPRGRPCGEEAWAVASAEELGLQSALRPRGRPRKEQKVK